MKKRVNRKHKKEVKRAVRTYEDYLLDFEKAENAELKREIKKKKKKSSNHSTGYKAFFDGSCEPVNPGGNMGTGIVIISEDGEIIFENSQRFPAKKSNTNNAAEYLALIDVLIWVYNNLDKNSEITIFGDSMLVINQMNGRWGISNGKYVEYAYEAKDVKSKCSAKIKFKWIPREKNMLADELSKDKKMVELI